ncbi:ZIP family metal transporter, partial [bacterium]|nr:ZIP family metal transporter [bacterium]
SMIIAFIFGLIAGLALLLGTMFGLYLKPSKKVVAMIMAFGSGVLISAVTFDLVEDAYNKAGIFLITIGFFAGALTFVIGDWMIGKRGGHHRKHLKSKRSSFKGEPQSLAIALGALLDGIPESMMIGIGMLQGNTGILMFSAVFLSNFPEGISGAYGISRAKKPRRFIMTLWIIIALFCAISSLIGFAYVSHLPIEAQAVIQSIAAGSIIAMITDTMIPEAYEEGGVFVALSTVVGFMLSFVISRLA